MRLCDLKVGTIVIHAVYRDFQAWRVTDNGNWDYFVDGVWKLNHSVLHWPEEEVSPYYVIIPPRQDINKLMRTLAIING
jgi:hypothetical protein